MINILFEDMQGCLASKVSLQGKRLNRDDVSAREEIVLSLSFLTGCDICVGI